MPFTILNNVHSFVLFVVVVGAGGGGGGRGLLFLLYMTRSKCC